MPYQSIKDLIQTYPIGTPTPPYPGNIPTFLTDQQGRMIQTCKDEKVEDRKEEESCNGDDEKEESCNDDREEEENCCVFIRFVSKMMILKVWFICCVNFWSDYM